MSKNIFYRLFGIGKIPADYRAALHGEGVILAAEGISGSVTYRNFRSPQRISNWKRQWHVGALALTGVRLLGFQFSKPILDVSFSDARFTQMRFSIENENTLLTAFAASLFQKDWSGEIEYRFKTPQAEAFFGEIKKVVK